MSPPNPPLTLSERIHRAGRVAALKVCEPRLLDSVLAVNRRCQPQLENESAQIG
jgi:hypothetical protein